MGYYYYTYIFKTNVIRTPLKIIIDPVRVEVFKEKRIYDIPGFLTNIVPRDIDCTVFRNLQLKLDDNDFHIMLTTRIKEEPINIERICEDRINRIITQISVLYSPYIFGNLIYKGWIIKPEQGMAEGWVTVIEKTIDINQKEAEIRLADINRWYRQNKDLLNRFTLMSRFYTKALLYPPSEERFVFLWTVLEVFPMKDTSNIKPISEYLSNYIQKHPALIKKQLSIGKIYGIRNDIVHYGTFDIYSKDTIQYFEKLEAIVNEILRGISGLPYTGGLEKYFVAE